MLHICIYRAVLSFGNFTLLHLIISSLDLRFKLTFILAFVGGLKEFRFFLGFTINFICILIVMIIFEQLHYFSKLRILSSKPQTPYKLSLNHANIFMIYVAISLFN